MREKPHVQMPKTAASLRLEPIFPQTADQDPLPLSMGEMEEPAAGAAHILAGTAEAAHMAAEAAAIVTEATVVPMVAAVGQDHLELPEPAAHMAETEAKPIAAARAQTPPVWIWISLVRDLAAAGQAVPVAAGAAMAETAATGSAVLQVAAAVTAATAVMGMVAAAMAAGAAMAVMAAMEMPMEVAEAAVTARMGTVATAQPARPAQPATAGTQPAEAARIILTLRPEMADPASVF